MNDYDRDTLFASPQAALGEFKFDSRVAQVFDDMVSRSVPHYRETQQVTTLLAARLVQPNTVVYDLGCSTGTTILGLATALKRAAVTIVGLDQSAEMLEKAAEKLAQLKDDPSLPPIRLEQRNLSEHRLENASVVILNYTLQFIRPAARQALLTQIYQALVPGGALILSEKLKSENPQLDRLMVEIYHNFKSSQGYSALEISQKREALENVLIPFSAEENIELLRASGFSTMEMALRWFNFATFIAIK